MSFYSFLGSLYHLFPQDQCDFVFHSEACVAIAKIQMDRVDLFDPKSDLKGPSW